MPPQLCLGDFRIFSSMSAEILEQNVCSSWIVSIRPSLVLRSPKRAHNLSLYLSDSTRAVIGLLAGRILQYGPLNLKL